VDDFVDKCAAGRKGLGIVSRRRGDGKDLGRVHEEDLRSLERGLDLADDVQASTPEVGNLPEEPGAVVIDDQACPRSSFR